MVREYERPLSLGPNAEQGKRNPTRKEVKKYNDWVKNRFRSGFPPWIQEEDVRRVYLDPSALPQMDGLRSSKTLRQWADEYCASPKHLKEFVYEKVCAVLAAFVLRHSIYHQPLPGSLRLEYRTNRKCDPFCYQICTLQRFPRS
jgi:hypothetical protein